MKKTIMILFTLALSVISQAQNINFEQYFLEEGSLRMDVFQCGNADTSHYGFHAGR